MLDTILFFFELFVMDCIYAPLGRVLFGEKFEDKKWKKFIVVIIAIFLVMAMGAGIIKLIT